MFLEILLNHKFIAHTIIVYKELSINTLPVDYFIMICFLLIYLFFLFFPSCYDEAYLVVVYIFSISHCIVTRFGKIKFLDVIQGVIEIRDQILTTSYWRHVKLGKNI
jgi:uncharacterized ion transporter superfamily protein YfcC